MHTIEPTPQTSDPAERLVETGWSRHKMTLLSLALILGVLALYAPATGYEFLNFDDDLYVTANPHVATGVTAENIRWALTATENVGLWHPLTWVSHMIDVTVYGLNPAGHHSTNILLHAMNATLLFLVLSWITGSAGRSFVVAALFAVHPLNIENVAWISERKSLLSTLFCLLAIAAYARYAKRPSWSKYLLVLLSLTLALLAKPLAVTIPVLLLLLDWWPLRRLRGADEGAVAGREFSPPQRSAWWLIGEKVPMLLLSAACSLIAVVSQERSDSVVNFPLAMRLGHAAWSYSAYVCKLVVPSHLAVMYPHSTAADPTWQVVLAFMALMLVGASILLWRRERYVAVGFLFYIVAMLPMIGVIQVGRQSLADRYVYFPAIGLFIVAVWAVDRFLERLRVDRVLRSGIAAVIILAFAAATAMHLPTWKNSYTVFAQAERVGKVPDVVIENNLAQGLVKLGRYSEAEPHYRNSIALRPGVALPHYNLGNTLLAMGKAEPAVTELQTALSLSRDQDFTLHCLHNLGAAYSKAEDWADADRSYSAALAMSPGNPMTLVGRGYVRLRQQRFDDAALDLAMAAKLNPSAAAFHLLGKALAGQQQWQQAMMAQNEALRLAPDMQDAQAELARLKSADGATIHQPGLTPKTKSVK